MRGVVEAEQQEGAWVPNILFKGKPIELSKCLKKDKLDNYYIDVYTYISINVHIHTQNIIVGQRVHTIYTWKLQLSALIKTLRV